MRTSILATLFLHVIPFSIIAQNFVGMTYIDDDKKSCFVTKNGDLKKGDSVEVVRPKSGEYLGKVYVLGKSSGCNLKKMILDPESATRSAKQARYRKSITLR